MFGAMAKSYYAEKLGMDPRDIFTVSIMPCTAKKYEIQRPRWATMAFPMWTPSSPPESWRAWRVPSTSMWKTSRNPRLILRWATAPATGVIFGATGGVMEAALRSAYFLITGKNPDPDAFTAVRGMDGWKEATFNIPGAGDVRVAVVSSLGKARKLIEAVKRGDTAYDFVEVMACPGGCAGGGGQPIHDGTELAEDRGNVLWRLDQGELLRFSHENPDVKALYKDYLARRLAKSRTTCCTPTTTRGRCRRKCCKDAKKLRMRFLIRRFLLLNFIGCTCRTH